MPPITAMTMVPMVSKNVGKPLRYEIKQSRTFTSIPDMIESTMTSPALLSLYEWPICGNPFHLYDKTELNYTIKCPFCEIFILFSFDDIDDPQVQISDAYKNKQNNDYPPGTSHEGELIAKAESFGRTVPI